ncbi:MAG: GYF domain-containing protein [Opitutus sp.]
MATQEFYIRNETDTEARGPFTIEQLMSLIDSSQVTPTTLYYDPTSEQWTAIQEDAVLKDSLFPDKKKLVMRSAPKMETLNRVSNTSAPIMVDDLLAAAEGKTSETKGMKDPYATMARAAGLGRWSAILALLAAAAGEVLPSTEVITAMDPMKILLNPIVIFGALDLFLAVILGLGAVAFYPFVRFRAALGLGFIGFIFFTHGQPDLLLGLAAGSLGLYCLTVFVTNFPVILSALLAIGGFAFVTWTLLSS